MLIPNKFNGYSRDGVRKYYMGGGAPVGGGQQNAYTPKDTNQNMVNQAYGNIGRASVGTNANQIDQGGQNYWMNQLNSGAVAPQDFSRIFSAAAQAAQPETANIYQNQALSQISGARPTSTSPQFYQPVQQQNYQNYASPGSRMGVSQYGQRPSYGGGMGFGGMGFGGMGFGGMGFGGMGGGYGQQGMFQMPTPFNPYTNSSQPQMQQPMPMPQRTSSGPSQAIVSRSAQMRGTPSVMASRAEGGIASLVDDE